MSSHLKSVHLEYVCTGFCSLTITAITKVTTPNAAPKNNYKNCTKNTSYMLVPITTAELRPSVQKIIVNACNIIQIAKFTKSPGISLR